MRRVWIALGLLAALAGLALVMRSPHHETSMEPAASGGGGDYVSFESEVMATVVRVSVPATPEDPSEALAHAEAVFDVFRDVDERMSEWKEGSPLTAVNRAAGGAAVPVPEDLFALLTRGVEIGRLTGGAFDITWAALWGLWDFRAEEPRVPPAQEIAARAALVDYRRVELDPGGDGRAPTVRLPEKGMAIGLGGIAKGYALERAAQVLRSRGVESFLVLAGGQVLASGGKGDEAWRVGIRDPRGAREEFFALLPLRDGSLSTSGDYERYFVRDGVRYHHVLDPRTGRPSRGVQSATVVADDPVLADALSTALMVLGVEKSLYLVDGLEGVEAVLVDDRGGLFVTPGLRARLEVLHAPSTDEERAGAAGGDAGAG